MDPNFYGGHETVYLHLSDQYLQHFLPIESSIVLPIIPVHQTIQLPRSPPPPQTPPQKSSKLFKTSVVKLGSTSLSPTTVSQPHAEIWRSETFLQIAISFWLSVPEQLNSNPFVGANTQNLLYRPYPVGFSHNPCFSQLNYFCQPCSMDLQSQTLFVNLLWLKAYGSTCEMFEEEQQQQQNNPRLEMGKWETQIREMRTIEDTLPKEDHLRVVRNMIKHMHYFVNNVHNDGSAMDELRKAITSLCRRPLYTFLRRHIYHWPLDSSFILILETYLSFIQPWRYVHYNARVSGESCYVDNRWFNFVVENFPAYTIIVREIIPRFSRMDLTSPKHAHMLFRLTKVLSQPDLVPILKDIERYFDESSSAGQESQPGPSTPGTPRSPCSPGTLGTPTSPGHSNSLAFPLFNRLNVIIKQEIQELESPNFVYKTLFGKEFQDQVYEFVLSIQQSLSLVRYLLNSNLAQKRARKANILHRIQDFFSANTSTGDDYTVDERQKTVTYLEHSIGFLGQVFDLTINQLPCESRADLSGSSANSTCSQQLGSVEPTVINPKDWQKRTKLIRYEANPDLEPIRSTEVTFLLRFLHHLCTRINESYKDELKLFWEKEDYWGCVARQLLTPPCKYYYFDKSVPGNFAPRVADQLPPRVSLRVLASHQTLSYIFLSGVLAFLYGYPVIPFYFFIFVLFVAFILAKAFVEWYLSSRRATRSRLEIERPFVPLDVSFAD
ncbi:hypothetical protein RUM44_008442 [Polyplax serrata]|uniref:Sphingomyelin phosphodiesterase 4 n=1 Tax=Polyplax serrata TaxID=468196 RepID=A0ABR1B894_POLSC